GRRPPPALGGDRAALRGRRPPDGGAVQGRPLLVLPRRRRPGDRGGALARHDPRPEEGRGPAALPRIPGGGPQLLGPHLRQGGPVRVAAVAEVEVSGPPLTSGRGMIGCCLEKTAEGSCSPSGKPASPTSPSSFSSSARWRTTSGCRTSSSPRRRGSA